MLFKLWTQLKRFIRNRKLDDHRAAVEFCLKSFKDWLLIIVLMIVCICSDKVLVYTVLSGKMKQERWPQGLWNLLAVSKKSDHDAYWEITSFNTSCILTPLSMFHFQHSCPVRHCCSLCNDVTYLLIFVTWRIQKHSGWRHEIYFCFLLAHLKHQ